MKYLRYIILVLFLCNIASVVMYNFGSTLGSALSYLSYMLLLLYYILNKKDDLPWPFVLFAITYFLISGINYDSAADRAEHFFYLDFIKYLIVIICGGQLVRNVTFKEIYILFLIGASSILVHAALFANELGRYGGFFKDPNDAGFVCLIGCCLTFAIKNKKWKLIGLFYLTFCGILTFSRTFLVLWVVINIIAIAQDRKNITALALGLSAIILIINISIIFQLNTERLAMLENIMEYKIDDNVTKDSRTDTWSQYYDKVYASPFLGNGFKSFTGKTGVQAGAHNTYLRIIGEAGILPFLIFISFYGYLFLKSLATFKTAVYKTLLALTLIVLLMATHDFVVNNHVTFISLWLFMGYFANKELSEEFNESSILKI